MRPGIERTSGSGERSAAALLLQILYVIRSEIHLPEQLDYNLLFRCFVDLGINDKVWTSEVFSMNRERLFGGIVPTKFFASVLAIAEQRGSVSKDHCAVDGRC